MAQIKKVHQGLNSARALLAKSGIRPRKRLGQHFLQDPSIADRIIAQARFTNTDVAIEVGAGLGALTIPILAHVSHVVAVEKDPLLIAILKERLPLKEKEKITLVTEDMLKLPVKEIYDTFNQKLKILGNLPYNISSPFLKKLMDNRNCIKTAVLMFQYEFAQRLAAGPRKKEYGALSVMTQYCARVSPLMRIKREAFYPKPKVDSMVVEIDFDKPHPSRAEDELLFQRIVKAAFSHRRKTILNSLERGLVPVSREILEQALNKCRIDLKRRAETLSIDEYIGLTSALAAHQNTASL
jgi:16S rRNA (adenine1518-N6/adenine1519-N6)-dimethyltransferase